MTRPAARVLIGLTVALTVASCSASSAAPVPAIGATTAPATTTTQLQAPESSTTPSGPTLAAESELGQKELSTDGLGSVSATAYAYRQPVAQAVEPQQPGYEWGAADVQVCLLQDRSGGQITFNQDTWRLIYADNSQAEPSNELYDQFPLPRYPDGQLVRVGECIRGLITYPVPSGQRPVAIEYGPAQNTPLRWRL